MPKLWLSTLGLLAFLASLAIGTASAAGVRNFTAHLSGRNEVPATDSKGQGEAIFQLNKEGDELHYKLIVANMTDITQAHIHCGPEGVNGPIVAFLFGFVPAGVSSNGVLAEGTITSAQVIPRPSSAACPGGLANLDDVIAKMLNGGAYANVHTIAHPGGEIRGQIK